ncbi:unnamed protein product [Bursaphelenchus xylophilus]|uniref:(pine wood nematode) hypothetical protein n=1 Tax=Bursaphelenchus xylophilus TaxID=6326 RepID=A0A7I8XDS6_BURXY|nr:unnamed protein product [Bursaphelenchus xylophilus]CAG9113532.1 unnamed protein product [Bursaphelenchus xylophilus]
MRLILLMLCFLVQSKCESDGSLRENRIARHINVGMIQIGPKNGSIPCENTDECVPRCPIRYAHAHCTNRVCRCKAKFADITEFEKFYRLVFEKKYSHVYKE